MADVFLRPLAVSDLERTAAWINRPDVRDNLMITPGGGQDQTAWFARYEQDNTKRIYAIEASGVHIGNLGLFHIDLNHRRTQLSIFIGDPSDRGRGRGLAALRAGFALAFSVLGLERVFLEVLSDNEAAIKTYRKAGMVQEGLLRKHARLRGYPRDVLLFSILRQDIPTGEALGGDKP